MEASCAIVKILQTFPNLRLPDGYQIELTGQEKQTLGILITSGELFFSSNSSLPTFFAPHKFCNMS